ncbi:hypothetical protein LEMLEM_LOCUS13379 [Lemmus lemmus]
MAENKKACGQLFINTFRAQVYPCSWGFILRTVSGQPTKTSRLFVPVLPLPRLVI